MPSDNNPSNGYQRPSSLVENTTSDPTLTAAFNDNGQKLQVRNKYPLPPALQAKIAGPAMAGGVVVVPTTPEIADCKRRLKVHPSQCDSTDREVGKLFATPAGAAGGSSSSSSSSTAAAGSKVKISTAGAISALATVEEEACEEDEVKEKKTGMIM